MIITIDIGNTNIVLGVFNGDEIMFTSRISTDSKKTEDEYAVIIKNTVDMHLGANIDITGAVMSSVVPQLNGVIKRAVKLAIGVDTLAVEPGVKTGIKLVCDYPNQVGADLICASVAAYEMYKKDTIVLDLGTATKFIIIRSDGTFIGLSIAPGVQMSVNALSSGTAQLPQISLDAPPSVIGTNTVDCMRSGVILGHACMIDGMIDRFCNEIPVDWNIVATGGLAENIIPNCTHKVKIDRELLLKGLKIIYDKNIKKAVR